METNDKGNIAINKGNKKQVKCYKFNCSYLNRELMIHEDIDTKDCTSVSDSITGFRLFKLHKKFPSVQLSDITEKLNKFIRHYTIEGIAEEFRRIEDLTEKTQKKE